MFKKGNKKLAKLIAAAFSLNSFSCAIVPVMASAAEQSEAKVTEAEKAAEAEKNKVAVQEAEAYQKAVANATANTISFKDSDDDLQFLNKVISLCTQTNSKKSVAETYKDLVAGAEEAADKVESEGGKVDSFTQSILDMDKRVHKIADDLKKAGVINVNVVPEQMIATAKATYQKGIADKRLCEAKAKEEGKDASTCVLSEEAASAANLLLTKNIQQVNVTATSPTTTNATEQKGASTIKNKDTVWVRGDDGLYHEVKREEIIQCKEGEQVVDGKCVAKEDVQRIDCDKGYVPKDGKCVKVTSSCKEDEKLVDGKCELNCADGYEAKDGKCVEITCGDNQELKDGKCVDKVVCAENEVLGKDGKCAKIDCGDGKVLSDGKCVDKETAKDVCEPYEEYDKENGKCVCPKEEYAFEADSCKENEEAVSEKTSHGCNAGFKCVKRCDEGETFNSSTGKCVSTHIISDFAPEPGTGDDPSVCKDGEEKLADGSCASKCAETEERINGSCVAKCASDEERKDGTCVKKEKCTSGYVESNGQCCPSDHPNYNTSTGLCMQNENVSTTSGDDSGDDGNKKGKSGMSRIAEALGTIGAIAGVLMNKPSTIDSGPTTFKNELLQYTFNYKYGKTDEAKNNKVHMFPSDSKEAIKFKLFSYGIPATSNENGQESVPSAVLKYKIATRDANGGFHEVAMDPIPVKLNEEITLFPSSLKDERSKKYAEYGEIVRLSAAQYPTKRAYLTMTLTVYDGKRAVNNAEIRYDFYDSETRIGKNPLDKCGLKNPLYSVEPHEVALDANGFLEGTIWDDKAKACKILMSNGTYVDHDSNERQVDGDGDLRTITSHQYTKDGCEQLNESAKGNYLNFTHLTVSADPATGQIVMSDETAKISTYSCSDSGCSGTITTNGVEKNYRSLHNVNAELVPVDFNVTYADGHSENWPGLYSDGVRLYDANKNLLTDDQLKNQMAYVRQTTGNDELYGEDDTFVACDASSDMDRMGQVCHKDKDGNETPISGHAFYPTTPGSQSIDSGKKSWTENRNGSYVSVDMFKNTYWAATGLDTVTGRNTKNEGEKAKIGREIGQNPEASSNSEASSNPKASSDGSSNVGTSENSVTAAAGVTAETLEGPTNAAGAKWEDFKKILDKEIPGKYNEGQARSWFEGVLRNNASAADMAYIYIHNKVYKQ